MSALPHDVVAQVRELRYLDGRTARETSELLGVARSSVLKYAPGKPGKVPVAPLREAFLESGLPAVEVARRVGWYCSNRRQHYADGARVKRTLGILPTLSRGYRNRRQLVDAETVMLLAEAIGVGWWEVMPDEAVDTPVMVAA